MNFSGLLNATARTMIAATLAVFLVAPGVSAQEEDDCPNIVYCGEGYTTVYGEAGCPMACSKKGPEFFECSLDGTITCPEGMLCCDSILFNEGYLPGENLFCARQSQSCQGLVNPWQRFKEQDSP